MGTPVTFEERYELGPVLGQGGLGVVHRATCRRTGRAVAAKLPLASAASQRPRILREARLLRDLDHPCLTRLLDALPDREGRVVLVYEFLDGSSLEELLGAGPPRLDEARRWLVQVAEGLDALHAAGLVHRDLKPGNLMRLEDGSVKLLDFGLARATEEGETLTATGSVMGTLAYMAPEQLRGEEARPATDLYALGCIAFELLTGSPPFRGTPAELAQQHLTTPPPRVTDRAPAVPGGVTPVLRRALAKDPGGRPASAATLVEALGSALDGGSADAPPTRLPGSLSSATMAPAVRVRGGEPGEFTVPVPAPASAMAGPQAALAGPRPASRTWLAMPGLVLLVATLLALGWSGSPATPPRDRGDGPAGYQGAAAPADELGEVRRQVDRMLEPTLRLTEDDQGDAREIWEQGRRDFRLREPELGPLIVALVDRPFDPAAHEDASRLLSIQRFLQYDGFELAAEDGSLFVQANPPLEDPGLARLVKRGVRVVPVPGMCSLASRDSDQDVRDYRAALPGRAGAWARLRDWFALREEMRGKDFRCSSLIPFNPAGLAFRDPFAEVLGNDHVALLGGTVARRHSYEGAPHRVEIALRPVEGDLHLLVVCMEMRSKFQYWLEFRGAASSRTIRVLAPDPLDRRGEGQEPRLAFLLRVDRRLLPEGPHSMEVTVRGLQPIGHPGWITFLEEVYQLVADPPPPAVRELLDGAGPGCEDGAGRDEARGEATNPG